MGIIMREMQITSEGLALIKRFEGFRAAAYRDSAGVWTIGYGHTSMAGAPQVHAGLRITRAAAEAVLKRDIDAFAAGVGRLVSAELSAAQFSALVSFAYNVGLGNFRSSSVLKAVNARDFDQVPRRLALWVKAGGRVLPGLVKRRAAEAEMFAMGRAAAAEEISGTPARPPNVGGRVTPITGKPAHLSTTNWAAAISAVAGIATSLAAAFRDVEEAVGGPGPALAAVIVIAVAAAWIIRERCRKSADEGV
jgi:lysozyme